MSSNNRFPWRNALLLVVALAALLAVAGFAAGRLSAAPTARPTVVTHVLEPSCASIDNVPNTFTKIGDLGTFEVQSAESLVETTFHGRVYASATNGTGVRYELRVDDAASGSGRIRAVLKAAEVGGATGRAVSMGGFWEGLAAGPHTVSLWAHTGGSGTDSDSVMFDPGCWSSDHVVIKEYLPFGTVALPAILRE